MANRDLPIAEAAAKAGFDCSDWNKLRGLITAVKDAVQAVTYPDKYIGAGRYQSSIYPDKWRPDTVRPRKGVVEAYRDAATVPSVPAFVKSAQQIIAGLNDANRTQGKDATFTLIDNRANKAATGTNREPLGARSANIKITQGRMTHV